MYPKIRIVFPGGAETTMSPQVPEVQYDEEGNVLEEPTVDQANVSHMESICDIRNAAAATHGFQISPEDRVYSAMDGQTHLFSETGYQGLLSRKNSGEVTFTVNIQGAIPEYLYFTFDLAGKQYAKTVKVNGKVFTNDFTVLAVPTQNLGITLSENPETHIMEGAFEVAISNWSDPNSTFKLNALLPQLVTSFTGSTLLSFKCSENSMDSELNINPGICEQYADVNIYDRDNVIHTKAQDSDLSKDAEVSVYIVDDAGEENLVGKYVTASWDIDSNNSEIAITCRDTTYLLEKIATGRADVQDRTLADLISMLFSSMNNATYIYEDDETAQRCREIRVRNNWLVASDLKTMLDKICAVGMLRIYYSIDTYIIGRSI